MTRLSPQVLVQLARRTVERELKWTRTELHAPPIPEGAVSDDPLAELSPLDMRLIQQLGFRAYHNAATQRSDWPPPFGLTAHELALYGEVHGILHEQPESGDIFLQRALMGRVFVHAGLVMTVDHDGCLNDHTIYYDTSTVEGDTDHRASVFFYRMVPSRAIRWGIRMIRADGTGLVELTVGAPGNNEFPTP